MSLKIDLHTHTSKDPRDRFIRHTPVDLVNRAIEQGYHALAITHHTRVFQDPDLRKYAEDNGLILIPGMEANVNGKHVLFYCDNDNPVIEEINARSREARGNLNFDQAARLKDDGLARLVVAAHPYFMLPYCLGRDLAAERHLFDFVELSWYHMGIEFPDGFAGLNMLNRNQKAELVAKKLGLPTLTTSDTHYLGNFGRSYSIIDAEPDLESILKVLQSKDQAKVRAFSPPLRLKRYVKAAVRIMSTVLSR